MNRLIASVVASILLSVTAAAVEEAGVRLYFPTENHRLLTDPEQFYQATIEQRTFGGQYGFTRSSERGPNPRFFDVPHMGIDVRPLRRDVRGEPLDPVVAAADGTVVYVNDVAGRSNYGKYVKIFHRFPDITDEVCTTYAHLAKVTVRAGQAVRAGEQIGVMGYTGAGINRERAHLHFEFGFRVLPNYAEWFDRHGATFGLTGPNLHGEFNGMNYLAIDPSPLLRATAAGKPLTMREIFARLRPILRVRVPAGDDFFYWQKSFPWMTRGGLQQKQPASWEIDCDRMGIPLKFVPSNIVVTAPELIWFDNSPVPQDNFTRVTEKRDSRRVLSKSGRRWFNQLTFQPRINTD